MGLLAWFRSHAWAWQPRLGPPPSNVLQAAAEALRRPGAKAAPEREAVLQLLSVLVDPVAQQQGRERAVAAAAALANVDLLDAVAMAVRPEACPSETAVEAAAMLATRLAAASASAATALGASTLVGSLVALLEAPSTDISPDAKLDVLACFRQAAARSHVRDAMEEEGGVVAVVATLHGAVEAGDWPLAGEAAWALEMMAGFSRRLTSGIGEAGGVEAVLCLLEVAHAQQPQVQELPWDEEAAEAAGDALHALLVLLTDNRRNRGRLRRAGGAAQLLAAFKDERLGWGPRELAATMLQDMAAALLQDVASEEEVVAAPTPATAPSGAACIHNAPPEPQQVQQPQEALWRGVLLPALVEVLQQRRGASLQESKEAVAGVLAKYAANGQRFAADVREARALAPLLQLLLVGQQLAGGERRAAIAALQALAGLVAESGCQEKLLESCVSGSGPLDLLGLLRRVLAAATAPELNLAHYSLAGGGPGSSGQIVAAGWHAASVAARLCSGQQQRLQDASVVRGLLPLLAAFVRAEPQPPPPAPPGAFMGEAAAAGGGQAADYMMAVRCEVAGLLRRISMRHIHHTALRACPGLLPYLAALLQPGAPGWTELKAAAKKVLQNLGEVQDTDRPLLTYTPQQLRALLEQQGIEASRFAERGLTGAEFVRLSDGDLRSLAAPGQQPRLLRVLQAYETFSGIDGCGTRNGTVGLAKMTTWLRNQGYRQAEVVLLADSLLELMDGDRDDSVSFPDFLQCYDEFLARTLADVQPPSKRRRTESYMA